METMSRFYGSLIVVLALAAPAASAGEQDRPAQEQRQPRAEEEQQPAVDSEAPARPRTQIRVLQDPKDLASFYRAEGSRVPAGAPLSAYYTNQQGGRGYYGYGYGYAAYGGYGYARVQDAQQCIGARPLRHSPYELASHYRK
jgi:Ni/Co efflux regulator RcnB